MKKKLLIALLAISAALCCAFGLAACSETITSGNDDHDNCQHTYGMYFSDNNATCQQDGTKTACCNKCGSLNTVPDVGTKLEHTFSNYFYDNNASCTQAGTKTAQCTWCYNATDTIADEQHPMRSHTFTDYKSDNNATCDENGTKTAVCDTCKTATDTVEEEGTARHSYVSGACSVCHASHLIYELAGTEYAVKGIADDCTAKEIVIPATENGLPVFSILEYAFKNNTTVTKVTMPDSVRVIGYESFSGCSNLESVIFGEGLDGIRYQAFANCTSLQSLTFPDAMTSIGSEACVDCTSLKTVSFGKRLSSLPYNCFDGCTALESVNISEENVSYSNVGGIVYQGRNVFINIVYVPHAISGLVSIADGYTIINGTSFQNRTKITGIYIPRSVLKIGAYSFNGCSSLTGLYYEGSEEEWNNIQKVNDWSSGAPEFAVFFDAGVD